MIDYTPAELADIKTFGVLSRYWRGDPATGEQIGFRVGARFVQGEDLQPLPAPKAAPAPEPVPTTLPAVSFGADPEVQRVLTRNFSQPAAPLPPVETFLPAKVIAPTVLSVQSSEVAPASGGLTLAEAAGFLRGLPAGAAGLVKNRIVAPIVERGEFTKQEFQKGYHLGALATSAVTKDTAKEHTAALAEIVENPAPTPDLNTSPVATLTTVASGFASALLGAATGLVGPIGRDIGLGVAAATAPPSRAGIPTSDPEVERYLRQKNVSVAKPDGLPALPGLRDTAPVLNPTGGPQPVTLAPGVAQKAEAPREPLGAGGVIANGVSSHGQHERAGPNPSLPHGLPTPTGVLSPAGGQLHVPDVPASPRVPSPSVPQVNVMTTPTLGTVGGALLGTVSQAGQMIKEHPVAAGALGATAVGVGTGLAVAATRRRSSKKKTTKRKTSTRRKSASSRKKSSGTKRRRASSAKARKPAKKRRREDRTGVTRSKYKGQKVYRTKNGRPYVIRQSGPMKGMAKFIPQ